MQTPENKNKAMADAMASAFEQKAKEQPSHQAAAAQPTAQVHSHAQPVTHHRLYLIQHLITNNFLKQLPEQIT